MWAITSSGTFTVCCWPSNVTATGVIWLPTTNPVARSTICANSRSGRSPSGTVPEYVSVSSGAPTTMASRSIPIGTSTPLVAGDGMMLPATPDSRSSLPSGTVAGPEPPPAMSPSSPEPSAVIGSSAGSG